MKLFELRMLNRSLAILVITGLLGSTVAAQSPTPQEARPTRSPKPYPIVVTPGAPSIWSMEQAHYLLNRLRATNDGIQSKAPTPDDLNPNAVNGIRLQALQTTLNVGAAVDAVAGIQNQIALHQFSQATAQHDQLMSQAQFLRNKLYQDQLTLSMLTGEQTRLKEIQTANAAKTPPEDDPVLDARLATLDGQVSALTLQNTATSDQITALTTQAGSVPPAPSLQTVKPPDTLSPSTQLLSQAASSLLTKTATAFDGPKLQASIALDNYLQMQYEIVAKQLSTLRDETGAHKRILFLEMPTSIQASDRRWLLVGGEDKLAQSWWRITKVWGRYKTENSPCWNGSDFDDEELRLASRRSGVSGAADAVAQLATLRKDSDALQADYSNLLNKALKSSQSARALDDQDIVLAATDIRRHWNQFVTDREQFLTAAARLTAPAQQNLPAIADIEASCRQDIQIKDENEGQLAKLIEKTNSAVRTAQGPAADSLRQFQDQLNKIRSLLRFQLNDQLDFEKARIYAAIGGPEGMLKFKPTDIRSLDPSAHTFGADNGTVRTVELIPRQTALNVNSAHELVRNSALSFVWNTLFSFGLKVDYQRQKENYDQFLQQESFSSSFGKGQATFGWTFGPLPGTRVLNSGDRNTFAVLEVPDDTSYLELVGLGCAFRRTKYPLREYPYDKDDARDKELHEYHCGDQLQTELRVPDRLNSAGFWLSAVDFEVVNPGSKTSVILRGGYFPPQTTVLVNGVRIPQVLGVGKPAQNMDAGPSDPPADAAAITGSFEYVNREQLTLNLTIPANYAGPVFPVITVVAPARAAIINSLPLRINGKGGRLYDDGISLITRKPDQKLTVSSVQYLGQDAGTITAHLKGQKITSLGSVRLNGSKCPVLEIMSENDAQVTCPNDSQSNWEFTALSSDTDPKKRVASSATISNPRMISITGTQLLDGTRYGDDLHPSLITFQITGTGFTPRTVVPSGMPGRDRFKLTYVSTTALRCAIQKPQENETITLSDPDRDGYATAVVQRPPNKKKDEPAGKSTTTTTARLQKTRIEN